jgi:putative peptidoglycan lipid II flippase
MAAGTALSRLTGVGRLLALAFALGPTRLADGYNLANTTPNMLYDIVLGGVLAATFIPVFVDRLATRREDDAWDSISAIVTVSVVILAVATVLFWFAAPVVIDAFTALYRAHGPAATRALAEERATATTLLRWFVPQVFFYGLISLATALLNTRRRFIAPMWAPIANNVVCIAVLLWFAAIVGRHPSLNSVTGYDNRLVLLGLGTTLGVAVQAGLLVPSLLRAHLTGLRWRWNLRDRALAQVVRLGSWTFGFVVSNQVALFVILALAGTVAGPDPVSSYTYAYTIIQMPYAVVAVSVMSAVTPDLAERWATGDREAFKRRLSGGLRAVLAIIIPASVGLLILSHIAVQLLLGHGAYAVGATGQTGTALAMFSLGLPAFCTFLYIVRVLQAMQRTRVAFWLYLVENGVNIVLGLALVRPLGVAGLALSLSIAYTVAAVLGVGVLRGWLGDLGGARVWAPLRRVGVASAIMAVVVLLVANVSSAESGVGLLLRVGAAVAVGIVVYLAAITVLGRRARRGPAPPRRPRPTGRRLNGQTALAPPPVVDHGRAHVRPLQRH